ncbi:MAG: threonine--tRNA ligase [Firmicutes bacterium]|nr:threonine--tRNA ligase [Bacillota bacterium]
MKVIIKDGSEFEVKAGASVLDVAAAISEGLARNAIAGKINGVLADLSAVVKDSDKVDIITLRDPEGYEIYRHSTAHIMAAAVLKLYPSAKLAIGPAIENGFYYDFDVANAIKKEDLAKIETEMANIIKADLPFVRKAVTLAEAKKIFANQPFKLELLSEIEAGEEISVYQLGDFCDLCRGPHLVSTGLVKAFKLQAVTGAYWRGDQAKQMLTRIYGTAWGKKSELDEYITKLAEAHARDHNKIGRELGYFTTDENIGQGLPLLMPNGATVTQILQRFVEDEQTKRGYKLTKTPFMAKSDLYKISGHWYHYLDGMFKVDVEKDNEYALRPMACPFQYMVYKTGLKSYKDLPYRMQETAVMCRKEDSGEMHGLTRVRQMTLSEGHIMITKDQLKSELAEIFDLIHYACDCLGIRDQIMYYRLSKWDPENKSGKYINKPEIWESAQKALAQVMDELKLPYVEADGEAAFYGPKIDMQVKNVYGKEDTLITLQLDFFQAEQFDMVYIDENGERQRPWIIHRSCIGTYERTLAFLLEHFAGAMPLWYAPVQVKVISLTDRTAKQASELTAELLSKGIRAEVDNRSEKVGYKIREAQVNKIPYMAIIGDEEAKNGTVAVRDRKLGDTGAMALADFVNMVVKEDREKTVK